MAHPRYIAVPGTVSVQTLNSTVIYTPTKSAAEGNFGSTGQNPEKIILKDCFVIVTTAFAVDTIQPIVQLRKGTTVLGTLTAARLVDNLAVGTKLFFAFDRSDPTQKGYDRGVALELTPSGVGENVNLLVQTAGTDSVSAGGQLQLYLALN